MNRTRLDAVIAALTVGIVALGAVAAWQQYQQARAHDEMMGHAHGLNPGWYLLGSLLVAGAVAGVYWAVRNGSTTTGDAARAPTVEPSSTAEDASPSPASSANSRSTTDAFAGPDSASSTRPGPATEDASDSLPRVLEVLPEDERRILEPVVESPGITQIALRDRADFSKSKVSQTVTDLEKRGLLYREQQGRTYRIYPSDDLEERHRTEHG